MWPLVALSQDSSEPPPGDAETEPADPNAPSEREQELLRLAVVNARKVEELRGLQFQSIVPFRVVERDTLSEILTLAFDEVYPDEQAVTDAWTAMGLLGRRTSLRDLVVRNKLGRLRGLYLARPLGRFGDGKLYVAADALGSPDELIAHELSHALSDQHYDLERSFAKLGSAGAKGSDGDRGNAFRALEEGVAVVVGRVATDKGLVTEEHEIFDRAVDWPQASILFRFGVAVEFVKAVRDKGGWRLVNQLYGDPPVSTEQIFHPERYLETRDEPSVVPLPDRAKLIAELSGEWVAVGTDTLGELGVGWLLGRRAASGWDGDRWTVLRSDWTGQTLAVWKSVWDSEADASELALSYVEKGVGVNDLESNELVVVEQRKREVLVLRKVRDDQSRGLRESCWKVRAVGGGGEADPPGGGEAEDRGPSWLRKRLALCSARKGLMVLRRRGDALHRLYSLDLDGSGRTAAKDRLKELREQARDGDDVEDLGRGRFVITGEAGVELFGYRSGKLLLGGAPSREDLEELEALLERL